MKKTLYAIEFALIIIILNIIPLIGSLRLFMGEDCPTTITIDTNYGIDVLVEIIIAIGFYIQCCWDKTFSNNFDFSLKGFLSSFAKALFLFGALFSINITCGILMNFINDFTLSQNIIGPSSSIGILIFIAGTCGAAMYEEIIYRIFLPEVMLKLFGEKLRVLWEIIALLLFVSGHFYLGFTGMLNALMAGLVLRVFYIKTKNIWINISIHSVYNLILFSLAIMLSKVQELSS